MGKPLISNGVMQGMYRTMQHLRAAKRDANFMANLSRAEQTRVRSQPESLYAALLSQVRGTDTVVVQGNDTLVEQGMHAGCFLSSRKPVVLHIPGTTQECAACATGMALQKAAGKSVPPLRLFFVLLHEFAAMPGVLRLLEDTGLPVLLIAYGEPESRAESQRRLLSTKVPIMPVDASDAVAVCRVLQECILRARNGWGGAVIHALHVPDAGDPIVLLEAHMHKRGLPVPAFL